jgi:hypothetical protein
LKKNGDAMTGALLLSGDPTLALGAATKQYVDTQSATLATNLANEVTRAQAAETGLLQNLTAETARATGAEAKVAANLTGEVNRAQTAEAALNKGLNGEATRAAGAEAILTANLTAESVRAQGVEASLSNSKVNRSGDTITGVLTITDSPV